ncbi:MAG: hypothetical protein QOJ14_404 [Thermoleophilaceae bacterium]|nr:hypothetical protein [Thermoleophilaceae bacterium]
MPGAFVRLIRAPGLETVAVLAVAAMAAAAVLIATAPHGPRVSTDSVFYLSTSDNLRSGHGLLSFKGTPLTTLPPGFPVVNAAVGEVAGESLLAARLLNSLCLGFIVIAGWMLLRRHVGSKALRLAGVVGLAIAPTLFVISSAVWSEPLFVALALATALGLEMALERPRQWRWVVVTGLLAGCSFSVRYSGTWLCASGAFVLLAATRRAMPRRERAQRAGLFLLVAGIVPVLVVLRNLQLTPGYLLGGHGKSMTSLGQNLSDAAGGISRWFIPDVPAGALRAEFLAALLAAFGVWLVGRRRLPRPRGRGQDAGRSTDGPHRPPVWPLGVLAFGYVAFLLASASTAYLDPIDPRLLSPAFVPAVVVALAGLDRLLSSSASRGALVAVGAGVVVMWIGAQLHVTRVEFNRLRHNGSGFTARPWRGSALVSLLRGRGVSPTFSNFTDALFFLTSTRADCWPSRSVSVCRQSGPNLARVRAADPAYLAWFAEPGHARPYVPAALVPRLRLIEVASVSGGRLYRVRATPAP